ncbi:FerI [Branchiostoma belcheri]|nr:FerI [Branchiostoma belcheri]
MAFVFGPIKQLWFFIWRNYKWFIIKFVVILCVVAIFVLFFYSMPGYLTKKMLAVCFFLWRNYKWLVIKVILALVLVAFIVLTFYSMPGRPDSSAMWFLMPIKLLWNFVWANYKWLLIKVIIALIILAFLVLILYSMPGYTVKKMFGV